LFSDEIIYQKITDQAARQKKLHSIICIHL